MSVKRKKHLAQHFLHDKGIAERIVDMLQAGEEDVVIEIGPGKGILTDFLIERYPKLELVEIDPEAAGYLRQHYADRCPPIHQQDILKWNLAEQVPTDSYFISNLPYNISSPIMFAFLENRDRVLEGVFMVQKEVAHRICSPPGSKQYGILSVLIGAYYDLELGVNVPPGAFNPPPKVQSAVFRMTRKAVEPEAEFATLKTVVKAAFGQRRKTLRNALKGLSLSLSEEQEAMMGRRAETLSVEEFVGLARSANF
jgi:16S rRNA (adenine1518-N6/adenine1519-N6)-dimethyltransferase